MVKMNIRLKSMWGIYKYRIFNKKNILLTILMFILINIYISPVKDFAALTGCKVSPWIFPFLISDANFQMLFMAGVIYYYSNVPFMQKSNSYYIMRIGRKRWIEEQIVYIVLSAFVVTSVSVISSVVALFPQMQFQTGWGKVLYTLAKTDAGNLTELFWNISLQYIRNYTPLQSMFMTVFVVTLGITFLGLLMLLCSLYFHKIVSVVSATIVVVYSSIVANIGNTFEKKFAMFSPISWMRVTRYDVSQFGFSISPSMRYVVCAFIMCILVMMLLLWHKSKNVDFIWENEEG